MAFSLSPLDWRADSERQHAATIEAVKATAQEMVPYNLTGYLDEFSKALAGEIRTLLGEVGRLHEQKRSCNCTLRLTWFGSITSFSHLCQRNPHSLPLAFAVRAWRSI